MRGMTENLTIGERVAWYRKRRGRSQAAVAGRVGRTADWLAKVENNRAQLDRLSVIKALAAELDVKLGDLLGEPTLMDWSTESGRRTIPALREALMDYRHLSPLLALPMEGEPPTLPELRANVNEIWDAYQDSRYGFATRRLPLVLADAAIAVRSYSGRQLEEAQELLAMSHQGAAMVLGKVGEYELAWMSADRGLQAAQQSGNMTVMGSLFRSVTHCLRATETGRSSTAVRLVSDASSILQPGTNDGSPEYLSVYGTLFLAGAMAAAHAEDRATAQEYLREAGEVAERLGADANHMWTAFGPTNVTIHRVAVAGAFGDAQVVLDQGLNLDTSGLPTERRVRHNLEVARALTAWNRLDEALEKVLEAEQAAPEQVRHHYLSREIVLGWVRGTKGRPTQPVAELAQRLRVV